MTVAVLTIIASFAAPSVTALMAYSRMKTTTDQLVTLQQRPRLRCQTS